MDRASWRGILEIEADHIALRDETGEATPIQNLFVGVEQITTPSLHETPIGPGLPPMQTLVYEDPTDDQVPALSSLLEYLEQDRAQKTYYLTTNRHTALFPRARRIICDETQSDASNKPARTSSKPPCSSHVVETHPEQRRRRGPS